MMWFIAYNWLQLAVFFALGFGAAVWLNARPVGQKDEDIQAQLAYERTRRQEGEAERARLRAQIAQITAKAKAAGVEDVPAPPVLKEDGDADAVDDAATEAGETPPATSAKTDG